MSLLTAVHHTRHILGRNPRSRASLQRTETSLSILQPLEDEQRSSRDSIKSNTQLRNSSFSLLLLLYQKIPSCMSRSFQTEANDKYSKLSDIVLTLPLALIRSPHYFFSTSQLCNCTSLDDQADCILPWSNVRKFHFYTRTHSQNNDRPRNRATLHKGG